MTGRSYFARLGRRGVEPPLEQIMPPRRQHRVGSEPLGLDALAKPPSGGFAPPKPAVAPSPFVPPPFVPVMTEPAAHEPLVDEPTVSEAVDRPSRSKPRLPEQAVPVAPAEVRTRPPVNAQTTTTAPADPGARAVISARALAPGVARPENPMPVRPTPAAMLPAVATERTPLPKPVTAAEALMLAFAWTSSNEPVNTSDRAKSSPGAPSAPLVAKPSLRGPTAVRIPDALGSPPGRDPLPAPAPRLEIGSIQIEVIAPPPSPVAPVVASAAPPPRVGSLARGYLSPLGLRQG